VAADSSTDHPPAAVVSTAAPSQGALPSSGLLRLRQRAEAAAQQAPRFLLLDWRRVKGLDATAARTFGTLHKTLARMQVCML